jgi:hypothetical protein
MHWPETMNMNQQAISKLARLKKVLVFLFLTSGGLMLWLFWVDSQSLALVPMVTGLLIGGILQQVDEIIRLSENNVAELSIGASASDRHSESATETSRKSRVSWIGILVLFLLAGLGGYVYKTIQSVTNYYLAGQVVREVSGFIESNSGQWPESWDQLTADERDPRIPIRVRIDFSLTSDQILADPSLLNRAITAPAKPYAPFPGHRDHIFSLLKVIRKSVQAVGLNNDESEAISRPRLEGWGGPKRWPI